MYLVNHQQNLNRLCKLIESEFTGTPEQFAIILRVPDRTLKRYIDHLKIQGANIRYSRSQQTYYFVTPFIQKIEIRAMEMEQAQAV